MSSFSEWKTLKVDGFLGSEVKGLDGILDFLWDKMMCANEEEKFSEWWAGMMIFLFQSLEKIIPTRSSC